MVRAPSSPLVHRVPPECCVCPGYCQERLLPSPSNAPGATMLQSRWCVVTYAWPHVSAHARPHVRTYHGGITCSLLQAVHLVYGMLHPGCIKCMECIKFMRTWGMGALYQVRRPVLSAVWVYAAPWLSCYPVLIRFGGRPEDKNEAGRLHVFTWAAISRRSFSPVPNFESRGGACRTCCM